MVDTAQIEMALAKLALEFEHGDDEHQKAGKTLIAVADILKKKREIKPFDEKSSVSIPPDYKPPRKFTPRRLPPK